MLGTGLGHYIPLVAYLGFWIMCLVSLAGKPLYGLYYMLPFLPYRTMRDHFLDYPFGANLLTILVVAVIIGAAIKGKRLPKSKMYVIWLVFGIYLYISMWIGTALGNGPAPIWLTDLNFTAWKDYMMIPLVFMAASMVIEDRKSVKMVILITAIALVFIDRSTILENMSRSWGSFDEEKRNNGPLAYGSNITAAFLANFTMFFWGFAVFLKRKKYKLLSYGLVAATLYATMYEFSRGAYLAILVSVLLLGLLKDRKLLLLLGVFLITWQTVVPVPVRERVNMTQDSNGQLEASAQERVDLWQNAEKSIFNSPFVGSGFATFQYGQHVDDLKDTHNWYIKVLVETGLAGFVIVFFMLQQMLSTVYRLFRIAKDPLYKGLGLGLLLAACSCLVTNFFGDRWTYIEIMGLFWVLVGAAVRAISFTQMESTDGTTEAESAAAINPYMAYR